MSADKTMVKPMLGYEAIARFLTDRSVEVIFGVPASETMKVIVKAVDFGLDFKSARHEQAAIGMADGYWRASKRVGVALLGRGPGLSNGANALVTAAKHGAGVLVIAGEMNSELLDDAERARSHIFHVKSIDQPHFVESLGAKVVTVRDAASLVADIADAYDSALAGSTVVLLVPTDIMYAETRLLESVRVGQGRREQVEECDPSTVESVADILEEAWAFRRPLLLVGRGAIDAQTVRNLASVADRVGALLGTSLLANAAFRGHPFDIGVVGTVSEARTAKLASEADLIIAVGMSLNPYTTLDGDLFARAHTIHVDVDAGSLGRMLAVDMAIECDAGVFAKRLDAELQTRGVQREGYRTPSVVDVLNDPLTVDEAPSEGRPGELDPGGVLARLNDLLPNERFVVIGNGAQASFSYKYLRPPYVGRLATARDYASTGAEQGIALGVASAKPELLTVVAQGDGAFMMSLPDLDAAVRHHLPVLTIVLNDGGFGSEVHQLRSAGMAPNIALYDNPDIAGVARALGARAVDVRSWEDLRTVRDHIDRGFDTPLVVVCHITNEVRPDVVDMHMRHHASA